MLRQRQKVAKEQGEERRWISTVLGGNSANELWLSFFFVCKRLWKCELIFGGK